MAEPTRILLLEGIHPVARERLREAGYDVTLEKGALKEDDLVARLAGVHVLGIRSKTRVTARVVAAAKDLVAIGAFCIGTNQIDLDAAARAGICAFNAPFSNTRSVAELVLAEVVVLSRQVGDRSSEVHRGQWKKVAVGSHEVRHKTLGIVGYGHIGRQVGVLAEGFGMRVVFHDIVSQLPMGNNAPCRSLAELLAQSDFVTLHVPETPQTRGMIGAAELAAIKRGACLLNASRGTVVDIDALARSLRDGHLFGAAVDVFPEEPETNLDAGFVTPLQGVANVVLTPHVGGSTEEAQESIGREVAESLDKYLRAGSATGAVNFPPVELARTPGTYRVVHIHGNVPGVLRDVNRIVSDAGANIHAQMLSTTPQIGYLVMDLDQPVGDEVVAAMRALPTTIRARSLG